MAEKKEDKEMLVKADNLPSDIAYSFGLYRIAKGLFDSALFPQCKNRFGAFAITQYGHELGLGPMVALQSMAIIQGKITISGQGMLALYIRKGGKYQILESNEERAVIKFERNSTVYTSTFTMAEAKKIGLVKPNSAWVNYPQDMLFWRAVTRGIRKVAPDAAVGLYIPDEINNHGSPTEAEVIGIETEGKPITDSQPQQGKSDDLQEKAETEQPTFLDRLEKARAMLGADRYWKIIQNINDSWSREEEIPQNKQAKVLNALGKAVKEAKVEYKQEEAQENQREWKDTLAFLVEHLEQPFSPGEVAKLLRLQGDGIDWLNPDGTIYPHRGDVETDLWKRKIMVVVEGERGEKGVKYALVSQE